MCSERFVQYFSISCLAFFGAMQTARAAINIQDVVNAASRLPSGFPSAGIAQGALFAVTGQAVGPDPAVQAAFPLPAGNGLGGVTITINAGGSSAPAIMVYASAAEVDAILPSSTPLGAATITINNNGDSATYPITVVPSAFGIFALAYAAGTQSAAAFNVNGDGSMGFNYFGSATGSTIGNPAMTGQTVLIAGTGLGAISSDETQSGDSDVPNVQPTVWVGNQQATVTSFGRGTMPALPDGLPTFPVPPGTAAVDLIQFTVPDGITGCEVTVAVQIGNRISNFPWISISPDGSPCVDPNTADFGDMITLSGTAKTGYINLLGTTIVSSTGGFTTSLGNEIGTSSFISYNVPNPVTVRVSQYGFPTLSNNLDPGTCLVLTSRAVIPTTPAPAPTPTPTPTPSPNVPVFLDAGAAINVKNASGNAQQLKKTAQLVYAGGIGSSFNISGLPPDTSKTFLVPGTITADNGGGGADVPAFSTSLTLPNPPLVFTNATALGPTLDRTQGVLVKWTGGDPASFVNITGVSINQTGNVTLTGSFTCSEHISAGQFQVPPFVTLSLPASASNPPQAPIGVVSLWNYALTRFDIPGIDLALFSAVMETQTSTPFK